MLERKLPGKVVKKFIEVTEGQVSDRKTDDERTADRVARLAAVGSVSGPVFALAFPAIKTN